MNPCPSTRGLDEGDIDEAICGCGCARSPCHHHDWRQHGERRQVHRHEDQSHRREGEPPALCSAKEATKGIAAVEPDCDNKAMSKFQPAYDKPGACGNSSSSVCESIADDCQTKVRMALPDGDGTNPSVCESKRLKAAGKKASGKLVLRQGCREGPAGRLGARRLPRQGEHQVHDRLQCPERLHGRR